MRDIIHNISTTQLFNPANSTVTRTSSGLDLQGYNSASILFSIGLAGDTLTGSTYWTLKVQHSDDNSTFADVPLADLHNTSQTVVIDSSSKDRTAYVFGYNGSKRYLRGVATPTGTHSVGTPLGILAMRGHAAYRPVA